VLSDRIIRSTMETSFNYRKMINDEWAARKCRNPSYSMRSYARDMKVSVSFLSRLLSGSKSLGPDRANDLARNLGWESKKRLAFVTLVRLESTKSDTLRTELTKEVDQIFAVDSFQPIEVDLFKMMSEWHYSSILELLDTETFESNPRWIAKRLGIGEVEAALAIDRLKRLGLLAEKDEFLVKSTPAISTGDVPSTAIRKFHTQMLKKAEAAVEGQTIDERDFSGVTLAIDVKKIPEVRELIKKFRRDLVKLAKTGTNQEVYHLGIQFFKTTQKSEPTSRKKLH
jgi:uncharacterized protein (TIGR02147 family)